jgi:hypothetical protein
MVDNKIQKLLWSLFKFINITIYNQFQKYFNQKIIIVIVQIGKYYNYYSNLKLL